MFRGNEVESIERIKPLTIVILCRSLVTKQPTVNSTIEAYSGLHFQVELV
ncbi:hypothetical protein ATG66_0433 [Vibrio sp. ES.051]|nr:hypothetical protein ATG66_0433 [Vibrio sp. ES.051]